MALKKSEMIFQWEEHERFVAESKSAANRNLPLLALENACRSFSFIQGKIQYERNMNGADEVDLEGVGIATDIAPLFFRWDVLDEISGILGDRRRGKYLSPRLLESLEHASRLMDIARSVFERIEQSGCLADDDPEILAMESQFVLKKWAESGVVRQFETSDGRVWELVTRLSTDQKAICPACGTFVVHPKQTLIGKIACDTCSTAVNFVFVDAGESGSRKGF